MPGPPGEPSRRARSPLVRPWLRTAAARRRRPPPDGAARRDARSIGRRRAGRRGRRRRGVGARRPAGSPPASARSRSSRADRRRCSHAVVARLRDAGAGAPDPTPKLVRALGPRALQPRRPRRRSSVDARTRRRPRCCAPASPPSVAAHRRARPRHPRRRATPRASTRPGSGAGGCAPTCARSRSLLDEAWSEPLRDELKWLAGELGAVRDRDVLGGRLRGADRRRSRDDEQRGRRAGRSPGSTGSGTGRMRHGRRRPRQPPLPGPARPPRRRRQRARARSPRPTRPPARS